MNQRIETLREVMHEKNLTGFIINNPNNIRYITDLKAEGTLLITDKENIFITDARYIEEVKNTLSLEDEISLLDIKDVTENDYLSFFQNCQSVGFEENYISYAEYKKMIVRYRIKDAVETEGLIEKLRIIKKQDEIDKIEKACNITDNCFLHITDYIKPGMTEKDIAIEIEKTILESGAEGLAFETVVASGENSSKPHAVPSDRVIQSGDPIVLDFGARYQGYCADMTRTVFVGSVSDEARKLYEFVLAVQTRAFNKMKNGADCRQIAKDVQTELNARNYEMIHALGHGVGIEVHEKPYLSINSNSYLKENMTLTNEPGIYIPGVIGIRIEDTVLINVMSARNLTKSNKNLLII